MSDILPAATLPPELPSAPKAFPALLPSIGWIALYFALQLIITVIVIAVSVFGHQFVNPDLTIDPGLAAENPMLIIWGLVVSAIIQLVLLWVYLRKDGRAEVIGLNHFGQIPLAKTAVVAVGALVIATAFNYVYATHIISGMPMQDEMAKLLASIPRTPLNIGLGVLAIAVIAPLIEELLFRGLLQRSMMHYVPAWAAIILSAFTFAVVHMQLLAMPALMALGAAFGYIYYKTGSLRLTIILHMVNNMLALLLTQAL